MDVSTLATLLDLENTPDITTEFSSVLNSTSAVPVPGSSKRRMFSLVVMVVYTIGIVGNASAIIALRRGERRVRNRKHLLLLTSLAANDLVALVRNYILSFLILYFLLINLLLS